MKKPLLFLGLIVSVLLTSCSTEMHGGCPETYNGHATIATEEGCYYIDNNYKIVWIYKR